MAAKEIKQEEFPSLEAANTSDNAKIHGVVSSLSPMKKGKAANFFEATITDGKAEMRVVGFQGSHRKRLADFQENSQTVTLENCKIKKARQSDDMEVLLKSSTTVRKSPIKLAISSKSLITPPDMCLKDLSDKPVYSKVSFQAKVINVDDPVKLSGGLSKQEVTVADSTAAARITLWQSDINTLEEFESYYFKGMTVRSFKNEKNLSKPKDDASITLIDDIGDVASDDLPQDSFTVRAEVIGVQSLQSYAACIACNGKVNEIDNDTNIGQCSKCQMSQPLKRCKQQLSAKLYIQNGEEYLSLGAFGSIVTDIAQCSASNVTTNALLHSKLISITYSNNIITRVSL